MSVSVWYKLTPSALPFCKWSDVNWISCTQLLKRWGFLSQTVIPFAASKQEGTESQHSSKQGAVQRVNWGYLLRKGHSNPVQHIYLYPGPILAALHLPVLPWVLGGLVFCFVGCQRGPVLRPPPLLCRLCPGWLLPLARLQELPKGHRSLKNAALNEATALQNLPFYFNFQAHLLFPYVSKHVRYFECDLLRTC